MIDFTLRVINAVLGLAASAEGPIGALDSRLTIEKRALSWRWQKFVFGY